MKLEILTRNEHKELHNTIIAKIRDLILNKNLEPGDKLPSERMLSEKFEVLEITLEKLFKNLSSMAY